MSPTAIVVNLLAVVGLMVALNRDRPRARQALRAAARMFAGLAPTMAIIIVLISLMTAFVRPDDISRFVGEQAGFAGTLAIAAVGAVLFIPALIAFPLAASLLESGASVQAVAAFITTLTMIGVVTLPLEIKELGRRMALLRNVFSAVLALAIALAMGILL
jgi:uncharacterized membrane protein YraQ (UPF0718 family)